MANDAKYFVFISMFLAFFSVCLYIFVELSSHVVDFLNNKTKCRNLVTAFSKVVLNYLPHINSNNETSEIQDEQQPVECPISESQSPQESNVQGNTNGGIEMTECINDIFNANQNDPLNNVLGRMFTDVLRRTFIPNPSEHKQD